ncbi:MAG: hypothetical protein PHY80_00590 [Rickettsiales bacterium]|nr:hypothetical protein [Rickettsiales bacterium]
MIRNNKGYNLLMLTTIVLILSVIMSAVLRFYSITSYKRRIFTTTSRFHEIDLAIKSYVSKYNRFPCPAPLNCDKDSCVVTDDHIGVERVDTNGDCDISDPGVFQSDLNSSNTSYYGGIPALTLGLANNYIVDGWGNKIVYIIPEELTKDESYSEFLYAKNHPEVTNITINGSTSTLNREYIKDGIVYLLISFNRNTEGTYLYDNKRANYFTGTENYPVADFIVNTADKKLLFYSKDYNSFKIEGLEEEMQICPDTYPPIPIGTTGKTITFYSGKYGEIVFSNEFCPSEVQTPAQASDYYYLSTYRENGLLIDNRAAKRCGKNGEWEDGFVYSCELLPKCVKPANDSRYSTLHWANTDFTVPNTGEAREDFNAVILKCFYSDEDGAIWYEI